MEEIKIIDPLSDPRWDRFVEKHPLGWIVHLSGWKTLMEKSFPYMKGYYLTVCDSTNDEFQAALPLFKVSSWLTGNRLVNIPFATLCDPLIDTNHEMEILLEEALNLSKKLETSYIEIRTLGSSPFIQDKRLECNSFYKHHYIPLDKDLEAIKKSFHRTNVRQRIQRALDSNINIKVADSESDIETFFALYKKTRRKHGLPSQPCIFFKSLWEIFGPSKRMMLLLAEYNGKVIAGLVLFRYKQRVSAEILGTDEEYLNLSPNHLLFWEAIKSAYNDGFKIFDFGRTSPNNESLMTFKNRWGTKVIDLPQFYYPFRAAKKLDEQDTSIKLNLIKKLCESSPDFVYREISRFCYKHVG